MSKKGKKKGIIMKKGKKVRDFTKRDITEEMTLEKMFVEAVGGSIAH